jgi:hypothetical protein
MSRVLIGKVEVDPATGKIYRDGKPSTRSEVDLLIMAAQAEYKAANAAARLARLKKPAS